MRKELSSKKEENGNIIFCYRPIKLGNVVLIITAFIPFYIVLSLFGINILTGAGIICSFISIIMSGYLVLLIRDKINKSIENKIIIRLLDNQIKSDLNSIDSSLTILEQYYKRTLNNDSMTYGYREYHIVLSDGRELKYEIINPYLFMNVLKLEINVHYSIS